MSEKINRSINEQKIAQAQYLIKNNYQDRRFVDNAYSRGYGSQDGNPRIRRASAYINRLEELIGEDNQVRTERQKKLERRLWDQAVESLVMQANDIPERRFEMQREMIRNEGCNLIKTFDDAEKDLLIQHIQTQQRDSAREWADYLNREDLAYPAWFKLYAWDGMSKLGEFDKDKLMFKKRDRSTAAPYPNLNREAVEKIYHMIDGYLKNQSPSDQEVAALLESGNFNKIYSTMMTDGKLLIETPTNSDDVQGQWVEYSIQDVDKLTKAAECTGWCIDHRAEALDQFLHKSGVDYRYGIDVSGLNLRSRFWLFHLQDQSSGKIADRGSVAIRLGVDGAVDGIYGLKTRPNKNDQRVEEVLMPLVEAKTQELDKGISYFEHFVNNSRLTEIDQKMQAGQQLALADIKFVFALGQRDNEIFLRDSRPNEISRHIKHNLEQYIKAYGAEYFLRLPPKIIIENLNVFLENGANVDIDQLLLRINVNDMVANLDKLLSCQADVDKVLDKLSDHNLIANIDILLQNGVSINQIVDRLSFHLVLSNLQMLTERGATIDLQRLVSENYPYDIASNLDVLSENGIKVNVKQLIDDLMSENWYIDIIENIEQLVNFGADVNEIVAKLRPVHVVENLAELLQNGANVQQVMAAMRTDDIMNNRLLLNQYGANLL